MKAPIMSEEQRREMEATMEERLARSRREGDEAVARNRRALKAMTEAALKRLVAQQQASEQQPAPKSPPST